MTLFLLDWARTYLTSGPVERLRPSFPLFFSNFAPPTLPHPTLLQPLFPDYFTKNGSRTMPHNAVLLDWVNLMLILFCKDPCGESFDYFDLALSLTPRTSNP